MTLCLFRLILKMKKYIEIVDNVVMIAYAEGFTMPRKEVWDMYAVKCRLNAYGYTDNEGKYFLNEKGKEYALSGCNEGIKAKIKRQEEIELLDIETKKVYEEKTEVDILDSSCRLCSIY